MSRTNSDTTLRFRQGFRKFVSRFKEQLHVESQEAVVGYVEQGQFSFLLIRVPIESLQNLSDRQREVARLASSGLSNKAIAERLGIREPTVANHIRRVYKKLGVNCRAGLARQTILIS